MITHQKLLVSLALVFCAASVSAGASVYIVNGSQQFGAVDLGTGAFQQIGPNGPQTPDGYLGLMPGPNGSLLTLTYSANLDSINPATGVATLVGATGLSECTTPASPCGPTTILTAGASPGKFYATDVQNRLYGINPLTGAAALIGSTGIPPVPFIPGSSNPDGTVNFYDQVLFEAGGRLYSTFDAVTFDLTSFAVADVLVAPDLYQIDSSTGLAMLIGPTALGIGGVANVNGAYYAFNDMTNQVLALDIANGNTTFVSNFDPAAGVVQGVSPVPEPASIALAGIGIIAFGVCRRRRC
jgi:hypothetical protein